MEMDGLNHAKAMKRILNLDIFMCIASEFIIAAQRS
jgi:hypothetical protein